MHSLLLTQSPVQQFRRVSQGPLRLEVPLHEEWWLTSMGGACISPGECSGLLNPFSVAWLPAGRGLTLSPIVEDVPMELQVLVRPDGDARGRAAIPDDTLTMPLCQPAFLQMLAVWRCNGRGDLEPLVTSWLESVLSSQRFATRRRLGAARTHRAPTMNAHEAVMFLQRNWQRQPSLDQMGEAFGLSRFALLRQFRALVGVTPGQYLLELRLRYALEMGSRSTLRLVDVAHECGFSSHAHFSTSCRQVFGAPPSELLSTAVLASTETAVTPRRVPSALWAAIH